jgi:hypothetical protein
MDRVDTGSGTSVSAVRVEFNCVSSEGSSIGDLQQSGTGASARI